MSVQVETTRNPGELAADLAALATVDWNAVWAGPSGDFSVLPAWCEQFGWSLDEIGRANDLTIRLGTGRTFDLNPRETYTAPGAFSSADLACARAKAGTSADNPALFEVADRWWPEYLDAVRAVAGAATVLTAWDDPDFPELANMPGAEERHRLRQPYRLASWHLPAAAIVLTAFPSDAASRPGGRGTMTLSVTVQPDDARH